MTTPPGLLRTPERVATLLSVAMIPAIVALIVTLTSPLAAPVSGPTGSGGPGASASAAPSPSSGAAPGSPAPPALPASLRGLMTADAAVLEAAATLQETLDGNGTGNELVSDLRRLNLVIPVALDAARAASREAIGGQTAARLATTYAAMRERIADGLAATVTDTAAYRKTATDVLAQVAQVRTLDAQLHALEGG